ncbi:MAG: GNAT family N-acetyltransferase [Anaerolineae bacterium]
MRVDVLTDAAAFETLRPDWNRLLARSATNVPFMTWEWQSASWDALGEGVLRIITARDDENRLLGIAPLYLDTSPGSPRTLAFTGGVEVADYLDCIVERGAEDTVYPALGEALAQMADEWDRLLLRNVPPESPTTAQFAAFARERSWQVDEAVEDVCPVIALPSTWDAYLESLGKHQRHEVRRKLRRIDAEAQWAVERYTGGQELNAALEQFFVLHRLSHIDKARFMDERMTRFFRVITEAIGRAGYVELNMLYIDGEPSAAMYNLRYGDRLMVYNSGYNPSFRPSLSSGIVLLALCIQSAIESGVEAFDFLQGDEEYKYRFGAEDTSVLRLEIRQRESNKA